MSNFPSASDKPAPRERAASRTDAPFLFLLLQIFLVVLAVSRYEATSFLFRGTDTIDFFNWFWRKRWQGLFSFFDFFLAALFVVALIGSALSRARVRRHREQLLPLLTLLVAASAVVRYFSSGPQDTAQDFFYQLRNYAYFGVLYFVALHVPWSERRFRSCMRLIVGLAILTVVLSLWESRYLDQSLRAYKYGRFAALRDVQDIVFLLFVQFWLIGLALERFPRAWSRRALLLAAIAYSIYDSFTGTGKAILLIYPVVFAFFAWRYRLYRRLWFVLGVGAGLAAIAGLVAYLEIARPEIPPTSPLYVYTTFTSEDVSVSTRRTQVKNFDANMSRRFAWLQGIGLGTKWYEYFDQPQDYAAFPESEWDLPWHFGVHIPFARIAYDFGFPGLLLLLGLLAWRFRGSLRFLRTAPVEASTRAYGQAAWLVIAYQVGIHNLATPKANLLAAVLLAAVEGLRRTIPAGVPRDPERRAA
jgi:hypothetical protein